MPLIKVKASEACEFPKNSFVGIISPISLSVGICFRKSFLSTMMLSANISLAVAGSISRNRALLGLLSFVCACCALAVTFFPFNRFCAQSGRESDKQAIQKYIAVFLIVISFLNIGVTNIRKKKGIMKILMDF